MWTKVKWHIFMPHAVLHDTLHQRLTI